MFTPNINSSPSCHISQHGSSSSLLPPLTPASFTPSISGLNIKVPRTLASPSISTTTPVISQTEMLKRLQMMLGVDGKTSLTMSEIRCGIVLNLRERVSEQRQPQPPKGVARCTPEEELQKGLDEWHQTQLASKNGIATQPLPNAAGGVKKGRINELEYIVPPPSSPILSGASTLQSQKKMKAMRKEIEELTQQCNTTKANFFKVKKLMKKYMPERD
ncbi:hypothetical protein HAX54_048016 [Datura stramonium]|uniref:Uncharacterized protein n=1 Tax=Datura stramonium TaxID=4076 RepID=A0ABS8SUQ2_DATST|nr:hypothetical protein [Datura stramonium]